jgi:hypothetical protein
MFSLNADAAFLLSAEAIALCVSVISVLILLFTRSRAISDSTIKYPSGYSPAFE